jgi:hypothetical protein
MNKTILCLISLSLIIFSVSARPAPEVKTLTANESAMNLRGDDSLRIGEVMKTMKFLLKKLQSDVIPPLTGEEKKNVSVLTMELKDLVTRAKTLYADTNRLTFDKMDLTKGKIFLDIESKVAQIKKSIPEKSESYHFIAREHVVIYKASQELQLNSKKPLLATYDMPYDPNTNKNQQVMLIGAYLNFYLEYRINVGGIELGPDIVDPERIVFTFPGKLLDSIQAPTYIQVKASPMMQVGSGKTAKTEPYTEQSVLLLVYPKKKEQ